MKEVAMAFVMKGLTLNQTNYTCAWQPWQGELEFIQDVSDLVAFDLGTYLEKGGNIDVEEKCTQVCQAVGHVLIEFAISTNSLPEEDDWELILSTIKARAEDRQYVLDILYNPPEEEIKVDSCPWQTVSDNPIKLGDKVMLSHKAKYRYTNTARTPYHDIGEVTSVETFSDKFFCVDANNKVAPSFFFVTWGTGATNALRAEELTVTN